MRCLAALGALLVLVAACGGSSEPEQAAAPPSTTGSAPPETTSSPATTSAPAGPGSEITGESLEGGQLSLADFRGKRVLVNVWSSW